MTTQSTQEPQPAQPVYIGHEFEALKLRYEDQVALLRSMTTNDWQIFTGYMTIQVVLGSWLIINPIDKPLLKIGLSLIDITLAGIIGWFLFNSYRRRIEVVGTVKNLNEALGFTKLGIYIPGKAVNPQTIFHPWVYGYLLGVVTAVLGICIIIFGSCG